jgi:hypothetical protein
MLNKYRVNKKQMRHILKKKSKEKRKKKNKKEPKRAKTKIEALTFPMASNPLSKKKIITRNEKNTPNPINPIPISVSFHNCEY